MAYPINPPAMPHVQRRWLERLKPRYVSDGLVEVTVGIENARWFYWEPDRIEKLPTDWLVGPYERRQEAKAARRRFLETLADGPELRVWAI